MAKVHAFFEDGVFRPTEPVQLPNGSEVEFEPLLVSDVEFGSMDEIYDALDARFCSGETYVAERHNEHQP